MSQMQPATILIVDDTLENLRLLFNMLTQQGYKVRGVPKGQKAIRTAQLAPPDLILLDIMMPEMDGYEVCQQLKASEKTRDVPIIFLSALSDTLDQVKAFTVGGVDYITKPFKVEEVLVRVENQLRLRSLQKQLQEQNTELQQEIRHRQLLEEKLRTSEAEIRGFFEAMTDIVLFINTDDWSIKVAPTTPERFYPPNIDLLSQTLECFSGNQMESFQSPIEQAIQTGKIVNFEYNLQVGERQFCFIASISPISKNSAVWVARDISDRKQAEAILRRRATRDNLISSISRAFLDQDIDTAINFTLKAIGEHTECDRTYILRYGNPQQNYWSMTHEWCANGIHSDREILQGVSIQIFPWLHAQLQTGQILCIPQIANLPPEAQADRQALECLSIESLINVPLLHRNELVGSIGLVVVRSPTHQDSSKIPPLGVKFSPKTWSEETINMLKLVGEIVAIGFARHDAEIARQQATAAALAASKAKSEFLANMSHELRTPLTAILGLSEVLREETFGSLTAKQHQKLATIEQSGQHLLELINDVLDLAKIESGKMEFQLAPTDIQGLCDASLAFVRQQAYQKKIHLSSQVPPRIGKVEVDERRMRQVLINLLSNAVKFTPEGGAVWIEVQADPENEVVQFSVVDTGIGIAPDDINKLFRPFFQLDSALNRRYPGTGLGLALVRQVVELHGGSVTLESEINRGSRFTVSLPWILKTQTHSIPPIPSHQSLNLNQVLIVEDSAPAAEQMAHYLSELGINHSVIHSLGTGTTEAALQINPDTIILDLQLPDRSGWDVLAQLKAEPRTKNIPILIVSVADAPGRTPEAGVYEYLVKPFSRHQFHLALRKLIAAQEQVNHPTQPELTERSPLILLAEDSETTISTLVEYLEARGYRMAIALNGLQAVQMTRSLKPNLVLMDIQMPDLDGLEATRQIRADEELAQIPIIALTSLAMPGDREKCLESGVNDYLTKPVSLKKLADAIALALA